MQTVQDLQIALRELA